MSYKELACLLDIKIAYFYNLRDKNPLIKTLSTIIVEEPQLSKSEVDTICDIILVIKDGDIDKALTDKLLVIPDTRIDYLYKIYRTYYE